MSTGPGSRSTLPDLWDSALRRARRKGTEAALVASLTETYGRQYSPTQILLAARQARRAQAVARSGAALGEPPFPAGALPGTVYCPEGQELWDVTFSYFRPDRRAEQRGYVRALVQEGSGIEAAYQQAELLLGQLAEKYGFANWEPGMANVQVIAAFRCARPS